MRLSKPSKKLVDLALEYTRVCLSVHQGLLYKIHPATILQDLEHNTFHLHDRVFWT